MSENAIVVWRPQPGNVYCMSALDLLRQMETGSVDCVVTDPPYGIGKATWDNRFPMDWITEAWRVSKRLIVMTGNPELIQVGALLGNVQNVVVMQARNGMTRSKTGFANWFPALICGEWDWKPRPNYLPFNVSITEQINHPSPKPLQAMMKLIQHYTAPGDLVLDPFAGSGTTLLAAANQGRRFIGCDISSEYVELCRRRLSTPYTAMLPLFAATEEAV